MKTAIIHGPEDIRVHDIDIPDTGANDVLVHVKASGICGSDVHRFLGTDYGQYSTYPMNSGHEYCGDIVRVGSNVKKFKEGDKVTLGVSWASGKLGAFSEFVAIPEPENTLCRVPQEINYANGALIETFLVAMNSYHRPNPEPDDSILILGAGTIGLCVLLLCRAKGLQNITVSEPSHRRRKIAKQLGFSTVDPAEEDVEEITMSSTHGKGIDVTFECAGEQETLDQAFALTKPGGRISLIGHYKTTPLFNIEKLIINSMNVFGPIYGHTFFDEAVELLLANKIDFMPLVSHTYSLEQATEAFETASDANKSTKVLFNP